MAALGTTVTTEILTLAGVSAGLAAAILGLTWVEASDLLGAILDLKGIGESVARGALTSYGINGRTVTTSLDNIEKAHQACLRLARRSAKSGGITALPIEWTDGYTA